MKIISVAALLSLLLLITCKDREEYVSETEVGVDSLIVKNVNVESGVSFYPSDSDLLIGYVSNNYDKYFFCSLLNGQAVDSSRFDIMNVSQHYAVDREKTTYIFNSEANTLLIRDSAGCEKYAYKRHEYSYNGDDTFRRSYSAICVPLEVVNGTLVMNNLHGFQLAEKHERELYYSRENLTCLRIKDDSLVKLGEFGLFPGFYRNNHINEFWPVVTRVGASDVYSLFSNNNVLYKYNINSGATDSFMVKGLDKNKSVPFNVDKMTDIAYCTEYETKISSYLRLLHDPLTNRFVVFQMMPVPGKPKDGMLSLYEDKPMVLNIVDSSMRVVKKIKFKDHVKFNLRYVCYYNNKIYILQRLSSGDNKSALKLYVVDAG